MKLNIKESIDNGPYYVTEYVKDSTSGPEEGGRTDYGMKACRSIKFDDYNSAKKYAEDFADLNFKVLYSGDNFTRYLMPYDNIEYTIAIETSETRGELHDPAKTWAESELGYEAPKPKFDNFGYVVENAKLNSTTTTLWKKGNISIIIDGYGYGIDNGYTINRFIIDNDGKALYDYAPPKYIKDAVDRLIRQGKFDNLAYEPNDATQVKHTLKYGNFMEESTDNAFKYDDDKWVQVDTIDGYAIYRKVIDGRGHWKAITPEGDEISITYAQALGYEPITSTKKMSKELGKKLLPKINERTYSSKQEDWEEIDKYNEDIKIYLDADIHVNGKDDWEYIDETCPWAEPEDDSGYWRGDEFDVYLADWNDIVEYVDDMIAKYIPSEPGIYNISGIITLVFEVTGIYIKYEFIKDPHGEYMSIEETNTDDADVYFDKDKSSVSNINIKKIK